MVNGPVLVGETGGDDVATLLDETGGVGDGLGFGSPPAPVQAAHNPAISPIASNRVPTARSWQTKPDPSSVHPPPCGQHG